VLHERVADVEERRAHSHANIVSTVLDFEQLAFIEKWRQRASRGVVIALDGTRGDIVVTMRAGDLGERLDMRGKDATGAIRKARLAIGDRVTMAIEYSAKNVSAGSGSGVTGDLVAPGAVVEGTVTASGDTTVVDCGGIALLVRGETLPAKGGDVVRFTIADEGRAYLIPTR
jgi:CBS domain-containing protein